MIADLTQLRTAVRQIFDEALSAVDAAEAVRRTVQTKAQRLAICDVVLKHHEICAIAVGKAALSMAHAFEQSSGEMLTEGVLAGPAATESQSRWLANSRFRYRAGGHPLPNRNSLAAAADAVALLDKANRNKGLIVFLVSGGGSAMMEWPSAANISLADLRAANEVLVNCGASISEVNSVRRAFSAVKGGKLAARAPNCDQITLIISDVTAGEEYNVASGLTLAPPANAPHAREVLARYDLRSQLPAEIVRAIDDSREFLTGSDLRREHFVLLSNRDAQQTAAAAAKARGFTPEIASDISDQPIAEGCEQIINRWRELGANRSDHGPMCLISGGEFACRVQGDGIGGRNLETALRLAIRNESPGTNFVALCAGTDGIDGNSPAAGAIVDSTTIDRARTRGLDPGEFLRRSDAFSFFDALGDTIVTGPTGTNVRDLRLVMSA